MAYERLTEHLKVLKEDVEDNLKSERAKINNEYVDSSRKDSARAIIDHNVPYVSEINDAIELLKKSKR